MGVYNRWWLRSKRTTLCIIIPIAILIIYYFIERETVLDQNMTRSNQPPIITARKAPSHRLNPNHFPKKPPKTSKRDDIIQYVEKSIQDALKEDKGTGCEIPKLDPFAPEVTKFDKEIDPIVCKGKDWVSCKFNQCRVKEEILNEVTDVECAYRDVIRQGDVKYYLAQEKIVQGSDSYYLEESDFAEVSCTGLGREGEWKGVVIGFRNIDNLPKVAPHREHTPNILILAFDSTSKNGFIRRMPKSYKVLTDELDAVILNGYNIVGDGTPAALFPILTGHTELELPEVRKRVGSKGHLDSFPFLWYTLKDDGYRTAYFEDSPYIGTFQYRFTGFVNQPTDHYLRHFFMQYHDNAKKYGYGNSGYCIGDTPSHALMLNQTKEFMLLDPASKKFIFTFIADITHDNFNLITNADERLEFWLRYTKENGLLDNTLLILMGDHGPRYAHVRNTLQGKQEERLPLMALVPPKNFIKNRPQALENLKANAELLTTPFDIHNTLLDLIDLNEKMVHVKIEGSDLPRSMSLFRKIPSNRSCSEAGIEPHWCTCLKWEPVEPGDDMFQRAGNALLDYINQLTEDERSKCVPRTLTAIEVVSRRTANSNLLAFRQNKDIDGYLGSFDAKMKISKHLYQVKIIVGPGVGIYEASMTYDSETKKFHQNSRDISRINAYNNEPSCISSRRPDLNMYCYCKS